MEQKERKLISAKGLWKSFPREGDNLDLKLQTGIMVIVAIMSSQSIRIYET